MTTRIRSPLASGPVRIPINGVSLDADLVVPATASGIVLFAHGSGSSRHSPRNRFVATELNEAGLGTLLLDLLTPREAHLDAQTAHLRFDIPLLATRLATASEWVLAQPRLAHLGMGYFGASTGAAAALVAAAELPEVIRAVVSRGGRPDLARDWLARVRAPTLLIIGSLDTPVIELNAQAFRQLRCEKEMEIVPRASHLFEEPGALEAMTRLAREWLARHLPVQPAVRTSAGGW
jgi:dienelactone hydrolase